MVLLKHTRGDFMNEYNYIRTPEELSNYMDKSIEYGYLGRDGKAHNYMDKDFNDVWEEEYILENKDDVLYIMDISLKHFMK